MNIPSDLLRPVICLHRYIQMVRELYRTEFCQFTHLKGALLFVFLIPCKRTASHSTHNVATLEETKGYLQMMPKACRKDNTVVYVN